MNYVMSTSSEIVAGPIHARKRSEVRIFPQVLQLLERSIAGLLRLYHVGPHRVSHEACD